jgi:hypothetical protein
LVIEVRVDGPLGEHRAEAVWRLRGAWP